MNAHVWLDGAKLTLGGRNEREHRSLTDAIQTGRARSVYIPIIVAIDQRLMSRSWRKSPWRSLPTYYSRRRLERGDCR
jgi:hypothetical protein